MIYLLITAGIFFLDGGIKRRIDKKYSRKVRHPHLRGAVILEKYYNDGAALNFLAKKPKLMRGIHTIVLAGVGICYYLAACTETESHWKKQEWRCFLAAVRICMTAIRKGMWWIMFG